MQNGHGPKTRVGNVRPMDGSMQHHGPGDTHNRPNSALCNGVMVMRSNPSEVKDLFEDTELCGKLLGKKKRSHCQSNTLAESLQHLGNNSRNSSLP